VDCALIFSQHFGPSLVVMRSSSHEKIEKDQNIPLPRAQPSTPPAPLSQVKVEKKDQFCAYSPIKMLLQHYHTLPII